MDAPAVAYGVGAPVHENFHGVQVCVFYRVGGEYRIGNLTCQLGQGVVGEIALHCIVSRFVFGEGIHPVVEKACFLHSLLDQVAEFFLGGGRIYEELRVALKAIMIHIYGDDLIADVGAADGFQLALHIEALIALFGGEIDLIIADQRVCVQSMDHLFHPSFTFTFSAGPPSLTRTHSL